ncbi:MAG TPA: hypothetical protein VJK26_01765 [Patescibacteria group bacterium]|nr:hypothetical protein [Patescibacteria group bacterium]
MGCCHRLGNLLQEYREVRAAIDEIYSSVGGSCVTAEGLVLVETYDDAERLTKGLRCELRNLEAEIAELIGLAERADESKGLLEQQIRSQLTRVLA